MASSRNPLCRGGRRKGVSIHRRVLVGLIVAALMLTVVPVITPGAAAAPLTPAVVFTRGIATSTLYFNRVETRDIAGAGVFGGACGVIMRALPKGYGIAAGALCALAISSIVFQAKRAEDRGMCLKIKMAVIRDAAGNLTPVAAWPDIYRGQYCR